MRYDRYHTPADEGIRAARADAWIAARQVTHLDEALTEASVLCHASADETALIYCTTDTAVTHDVTSGELYLVFRGDDSTSRHLRSDQGWRLAYTLQAGGTAPCHG